MPMAIMPQASDKVSRFSKTNEEDAEGSVAWGTIGVFCKRPVGNHPIEKVRKNHWSAIK